MKIEHAAVSRVHLFCNLTMKIHGSTGIPTAKVVKCILSMSTNLCRSDVGCSRFPNVGHSLPLPFV